MNELYPYLLKNLPKEVEYLRLNFGGCKTLTNNGFKGVVKAIAN